MPRLAIVTSHPVQYNAPLFKRLAEVLEIKVFYTWGQAKAPVYDPGFGKTREWDIPLLEGYAYSFIENTSKNPGSHHFWGIQNPNLIFEIENWQPDAILVFGWSFYSHLRCLLHFKNKLPVFFRGDSTLIDEIPPVRAFIRRMALKFVYRHIDVAFYVGRNNKKYFQRHGLKEGQLIYAPHAVDNNRFSQFSPEDERFLSEWKRRIGINENDWVILFVGKMEKKKNPQFILRLAEHLKDPDLKFLLVGNGHMEQQLRQKATDQRIIFLDFQNQLKMPLIYRLGNLLVLPSRGPGETWGLAANEAMAAGLPVAMSVKAGGAIDLIMDRLNGIHFEPGEIERVVDFIRYLKKDKEMYLKAKRLAVEHIQNFHLQRTAAAIGNAVKVIK